MQNILVTGGAGFIGTNLIKRLKADWPEAKIVSLDNYFTGKRENHIPGVKYIAGNTMNSHSLLADYSFDTVFILVSTVESINLLKIFTWQLILLWEVHQEF